MDRSEWTDARIRRLRPSWSSCEHGPDEIGSVFARLHKKVLASAEEDATCKLLMTIPGVGAVTALAYTATIDIPQRFRISKAVGPPSG